MVIIICGANKLSGKLQNIKLEVIFLKLNNDLCELIAELEYIVGSECYNPNSYDGWNDVEGCSFRYPINVPNSEGEYRKIRSNINTYFYYPGDISAESITYMKYKFGSNELYIGKGIIGILEYLEKRYGLNFTQLEENLKK